MAELLATGTTATASSDFVLADGQVATVFLKNSNTAGGVVSGGNAVLQIKSADGYYYDVPNGRITEDRPLIYVEKPGTYRVRRPVADVAYGIDYVTGDPNGGLSAPAVGYSGLLRATNGDYFPGDGAQTISYNADNTIAYIQIASGSDNYRQTWTWTSGNLTAVSGWVKQ